MLIILYVDFLHLCMVLFSSSLLRYAPPFPGMVHKLCNGIGHMIRRNFLAQG